MLVYDITDMITFESVRIWMNQIKIHADAGVCVVLVGNKCDLENHRVCASNLICAAYDDTPHPARFSSSAQVVPTSAGAALAKEFGIPFMETSAVESVNVDEAFSILTKNVYDRLEEQGLLPPHFGAGVYGGSGSNGSPASKRPSVTGVDIGAKKPAQSGNVNCCS